MTMARLIRCVPQHRPSTFVSNVVFGVGLVVGGFGIAFCVFGIIVRVYVGPTHDPLHGRPDMVPVTITAPGPTPGSFTLYVNHDGIGGIATGTTGVRVSGLGTAASPLTAISTPGNAKGISMADNLGSGQ